MMTEYILSPSTGSTTGRFAALCISWLNPRAASEQGERMYSVIINAAKRPVVLPVEGVSLRELAAVKRIVVFLPDDPRAASEQGERMYSVIIDRQR
jgi:hypothetical protein